MAWYSSFSITELVFIGLFVIFYLSYLIRVVRIAGKLRTPFQAVFIKLFFRSVYFLLLIVALLGPSFGESKQEIKSVGKDIFICVDLSQSMNASDIAPTRLEKVKYELKNIVKAFPSDRVGLIIFSSEAFIQCPLTFDQNALFLFIETLTSGLVPNTGTDFGPPLEMALDKLSQEERLVTQQKSKAIILISDGEDFGDDTQQVAEKIETEGIKLFTLGVGTQKGSKLRTSRGFKRDRDGNEVITKLEAKSLKAIASQTNGKYFEINASNNDIARLINTINRIEGELRESRQIDVSANKYYYALMAALLFIFFDILISLKTIRI